MIGINIIQKVLKQFNGEYTHNLDDTKGLNLEVFSFECLKKAYFNAKSDFEKEHVTPWIKVNCKNKNVKLNFDRAVKHEFDRVYCANVNGNQCWRGYIDGVHVTIFKKDALK